MVIVKDEYLGTAMRVLENGGAMVENKPDIYTEFVTVNELRDDVKTAKDEYVITLCNFIFELDNEDVETQKERAKRLFESKIVNRAVFSGSKSIHCRITVVDMPEDKEEYKFVWGKLNKKCFDGKADRACSNPARLTRMPNAIRSNGVKQQRLHLSNEMLDFDWRREYELEKQIEAYVANRQIHIRNHGNGRTPVDILLKRNIPIGARKLLENSFMDGERHEMMPGAIWFLKKCGYTLAELETLVRATRINDGVNYVRNMYGYK
jgi:hypothetical protein